MSRRSASLPCNRDYSGGHEASSSRSEAINCPTGYSQTRNGYKEFFIGNSPRPRLVDRHRRQLDLAVRAAAARSCQSLTQTKGRRNQTLQLQRRDSILMNKLLFSAALAASLGAGSAANAQAIPGAIIAVVDLEKVTSECTACKAAAATLRSQIAGLQTREQALSTPLQDGTEVDPDGGRCSGRQATGRCAPGAGEGMGDEAPAGRSGDRAPAGPD